MRIYGGHLWTHQDVYMGALTMFEWGAVRTFKRLPADVARAFDGNSKHWRAFAGPDGHAMGEGYITKIILNSDESGSYEFSGAGKLLVCDDHGDMYDFG